MSRLRSSRDTRTAAWLDAGAALAVGVVAFVYRYLAHNSFSNDQYIHLSRAQAWLAGEWPIRDFTEPGTFLTVAVSAAAQLLFGHTLLPELILSVLALALAAAITCWLTTRLTGSRTWGVVAALMQIVVFPRLYSYPKIALYPLAFFCLRRYLQRPGRAWVAALAVVTAIAFLFRHDHGLYVGVAIALTMIVVDLRDRPSLARRNVVLFGSLVLVCVSPFFIYVQAHGGLVSYFRVGTQFSRAEAMRTAATFPSFRLASGPLFVRRAIEIESLPRIHIRWTDAVDDTRRRALEQSVPLLAPERVEGRTWRYRVDPRRRASLRVLMRSADVNDVDGIDRQTLALTEESSWSRIQRVVKITDFAGGPGLTQLASVPNAAATLFYTAWLLPLAAIWLWRSRQLHLAEQSRAEWLIPALCLQSILCSLGFLRDPPAARIADVFGTFPILLSWVLAELFATEGRIARLAARSGALVLLIAVTIDVIVVGNAREIVARTQVFHGPAAMVAHARATIESTRTWPWTAQWPNDNELRLVEYVHACTAPDDRLLVTWAGSEYYVFTQRMFAGREPVLMPISRPPQSYEGQVLDAWKRQRVPIVLADADQYRDFEAAYPALSAYLAREYRVIDVRAWESGRTIRVHVDRHRPPVRRDPRFGWPCFA